MHEIDQGLGQAPDLHHPGGQGRARQLDPDPLQSHLLAVERHPVHELLGGDVGQECRRGDALRDRLKRNRGHLHAFLAGGAPVLGPDVPHPAELGRDDLQLFALLTPDLHETGAVARTDLLCIGKIVNHLDAGERLREGPSASLLARVRGDLDLVLLLLPRGNLGHLTLRLVEDRELIPGRPLRSCARTAGGGVAVCTRAAGRSRRRVLRARHCVGEPGHGALRPSSGAAPRRPP